MAKGVKTGGRTKGTPNKATAQIKSIAQKYSAEAIRELARLGREAESEAARVSAWREILDRAHGKPSQSVDGNFHHSISQQLAELMGASSAGLPGPEDSGEAE